MNNETKYKQVIYEGKIHNVDGYFCGDPTVYFLKSNFSGGSNFPAKVSDCTLIENKFQFYCAEDNSFAEYVLKANENYGVQIEHHAGLNGIETYYTPRFWDDEADAMDFADEYQNLNDALECVFLAWQDAMETADEKMGDQSK